MAGKYFNSLIFQNGRQHHIENQKKWYLLNQIDQRGIWSVISY